MDFSDIEISRGLQYGAVGSTTCDWGDDGHYHLPAVTWFPFVYHAASAWTGATLDRDYFKQAIKGNDYVSHLEIGTASSQPGVYFSSPVRTPSQFNMCSA